MSSEKERKLDDESNSANGKADMERAAPKYRQQRVLNRIVNVESNRANDKGDMKRAAPKSRDSSLMNKKAGKRKVKASEVKESTTPSIFLIDVIRESQSIFRDVLKNVTGDLGPNDMIKFCINTDSLDYPISTGLLPSNQLTPEKIISSFEKVMPSGKEIPENETLEIDVEIARP